MSRLAPSASDSPGLAHRVRDAVSASGHKLVVIIDEVTGSQAVGDVPVLAERSAAAIATELVSNRSATVLLTHSREMEEAAAAETLMHLGGDVIAAARATRSTLTLLHRLDPNLAGHVVAETQALADRMGGFDGVVFVPAYFEAGYFTIDAIQWVRAADRLIPLAASPQSKDPRFPVRESDFRRWLEARSGGTVPPGSVEAIMLPEVRAGRDRLARRLGQLRDERYVVVDAATMDDLYHLVLACVEAERRGARLLYRAGPSFTRAFTTHEGPSTLRVAEVFGAARASSPGIMLLGPLTTRNAPLREALRGHPSVLDLVIEPMADAPVQGPLLPPHHFRHLADQLGHALHAGLTPMLSFSARAESAAKPLDPATSARTLTELVRSLSVMPSWILVESGSVANAVTRHGLEVRRAEILGQLGPGLTAWRLDAESQMAGGILVVATPDVADPRIIARLIP